MHSFPDENLALLSQCAKSTQFCGFCAVSAPGKVLRHAIFYDSMPKYRVWLLTIPRLYGIIYVIMWPTHRKLFQAAFL